MSTTCYERKTTEESKRYSSLSWKEFSSGIESLVYVDIPVVKIKIPNASISNSVSKSWKKVGKLIMDSYVKETSAYNQP